MNMRITTSKVAVPLSPPSILQVFVGSIIFLVNGSVCPEYPAYIGPYRFVRRIPKSIAVNKFAVGIYEREGKRFFIKTWYGTLKDIRYYALLNEYFVCQVVRKKIEQTAYKGKISIPEIHDFVTDEHSLSIVSEYIDGIELGDLSLRKQADVIYEICEVFREITHILTNEDKKIFTRHTISLHVLSTLSAVLISIYKYPKKTLIILKSLCRSLVSAQYFRCRELILAHRDLSLSNVLIKGDMVYIVDCEEMVLTLPSHDVTAVSMSPGFQNVEENETRGMSTPNNAFLQNYIALHGAIGCADIPAWRNHYLSYLK